MTNKKDMPTFVTGDTEFALSHEYAKWINDIKNRFKRNQIKASIRVNDAMLDFYWSLGKGVVEMQKKYGWGSGVIKQASLDLKKAFPSRDGFSVRNIECMKRWYLFYNEYFTKSQQVVAQLPQSFALVPWSHHLIIISKSKTVEEALFYIDKVLSGNWSRRELEDNITTDLYSRQGKALTNFSEHLPTLQCEEATQVLKDPYNFDFLTMRKGYDEKELEEALVHNITHFLLELGQGFAFVGRQVELRMPNGKSYFPDLIFYHIRLKRYIVVELKVVDFEPEFAGKLNFYVSAADELLKSDDDNSSVGLLICKSKDATTVKWSFKDINKPIGVAEYQLKEIVDRTLSDMEHLGEDKE